MKKLWCFTMQLGFNMWRDAGSHPENRGPFQCQATGHYQTEVICDKAVWRRVVDQLPGFGVNAVLIDIGEGLQYHSHPELALPGAWSHEELQAELDHIRALGMEPLPMLNFSSYHDAWLGGNLPPKGSDAYHALVKELIDEVATLFGHPSLFHLGMDEEHLSTLGFWDKAWWQNRYERTNSKPRTEEEYWSDVLFMIDCVKANGSRAWLSGDWYSAHKEGFGDRMPKDAVLSLSYFDFGINSYNGKYSPRPIYDDIHGLHDLGYDQIHLGSNFTCHENLPQFVHYYMMTGIADDRLLGFNASSMQATVDLNYYTLVDLASRVAAAREMFEAGQ